ncbi:hypothetical protein ACFVUS_10875 [Nocardia sp. NPDC058058]|uniref:hypothetical protein n=1 Tax=Nocardia sp. NPDC058058 TaxID=3346317 RepID=UPI0036DB5149
MKDTPKKPVGQRSWRDRRIELTKRRVVAASTAAAIVLGGSAAACGYLALARDEAADRVSVSQSRAADRDAATKAGSTFLTTMFTVNDASLDRWDSAVVASTTDSMHDQLAQWRTVLDKLVKAHLEMASTVQDVGVVAQHDDAVTLLAVIESTGRTDPDAKDPGTTYSSALVDLRKINGDWKVSSYGPAGGLPPTPAAPPAPAPTPDQTPR